LTVVVKDYPGLVVQRIFLGLTEASLVTQSESS
jgi:hypothetical protein